MSISYMMRIKIVASIVVCFLIWQIVRHLSSFSEFSNQVSSSNTIVWLGVLFMVLDVRLDLSIAQSCKMRIKLCSCHVIFHDIVLFDAGLYLHRKDIYSRWTCCLNCIFPTFRMNHLAWCDIANLGRKRTLLTLVVAWCRLVYGNVMFCKEF